MTETLSTKAIGGASAVLKHTAQAIGAIVVIGGFLWAFAQPAAEAFVKKSLEKKLGTIEAQQELYSAKQETYQTEQKRLTSEVTKQQAVIIERQRIRDVLDAEMRADVKTLLRLLQRSTGSTR